MMISCSEPLRREMASKAFRTTSTLDKDDGLPPLIPSGSNLSGGKVGLLIRLPVAAYPPAKGNGSPRGLKLDPLEPVRQLFAIAERCGEAKNTTEGVQTSESGQSSF
jgi:hypothetical protein